MSTPRVVWLSPLHSRYLVILFASLLLLLLTFVPLTLANAPNTKGKLLVIYIDAMRWDYIERRLDAQYKFPNPATADRRALLREPTNGLFLMKRFGSFVRRVKPVFPTQCLPNIMSAFTGRFPRHHGMLGNQMYDANSGFHFDYHKQENRVAHFRSAPGHWWDSTEPLWESLEKRHSRRATVYNVPTAYELRELRRNASEVARGKGKKVGVSDESVYYPYARGMNWVDFERNLMDAISRLRKNTTDLAVVYTDLLDRMGHSYGPLSSNVERVMAKLDSTLHIALHELLLEPASANLHMMLMSDHGMQAISQTHSVRSDWYILRSSVLKVVNDGTIAGIWPEKGRAKQVFNRLLSHQARNKGFKVFWRSDPRIQHFSGHDPKDARIPPIVVVAAHGYVLITREFPFPRDGVTGAYPQEGLHGYHPNHAEMHTAMMVAGPKVHGGIELSGLDVTEIYQLMCYLLGVPTQPHNGTFSKIGPILREWTDRHRPQQIALDAVTTAATDPHSSAGVGLRSDVGFLLLPVLLLVQNLISRSQLR